MLKVLHDHVACGCVGARAAKLPSRADAASWSQTAAASRRAWRATRSSSSRPRPLRGCGEAVACTQISPCWARHDGQCAPVARCEFKAVLLVTGGHYVAPVCLCVFNATRGG
eukprot:scaffold98421_cov46-Phaeocystis_antarctica.AAC.1